MKNMKTYVLVAIAIGFLAACAGVKARTSVLMPAMSAQYSHTISPLVQRGAADDQEVLALDAAMLVGLEARDPAAVLSLDWDALRFAAVAGIQIRVNALEIGPGVAVSKVEALNVFELNLKKLGER